jgi:hypothetical protein
VSGPSASELVELAGRLAVVPADVLAAPAGAAVPMGGWFVVEGSSLRFRPRHPFAPGTTYAVVWRAGTGAVGTPLGTLTRPAVARPSTTAVLAVHPAVDEVPVNLLRLYVHFSGPMSEGFADRCVRLADAATGAELAGALLSMDPELWDPGRTRLTVLLDPGRIKRGLVPNAEAGYPLVEGRAVRVVVDAAMPDASGAPLVAGAAVEYAVGPVVRHRVRPAAWQVLPPGTGTADPVRVRFDRPLDHALATRCLTVVDAAGGSVEGQVEVGEGERLWSCRPVTPWRDEPYRIAVADELEDLAGNSVRRPFDRDLSEPDDDPPTAGLAVLGFRPS